MKKCLIISLLIVMLVSVSACSGSRETKPPGKDPATKESPEDPQNIYKLPAKATIFQERDGEEAEETITLVFNSRGDIIESSAYSGKAETVCWNETGKKKEVIWTGQGYNSVETLYYDKEGHLINSVDDWGDLDAVLTYDFEYLNGWISKRTDHFPEGPTDVEHDLNPTFHDNGMIASAGDTFFNDNGLVEKYEFKDVQYPNTYTVEYEYDDDGNVISALMECTDDLDGSVSQARVNFEYEDTILVSRRVQSAWINYCLPLPTNEFWRPYADILGMVI